MTDYIQKMMKMVGAEAKYFVKGKIEDASIYATFPTEKDAKTYQSEFGGNLTIEYDFTPEKQLEIIKLISKNDDEDVKALAIDNNTRENDYCFLYRFYAGDDNLYERRRIYNQDFPQALAQLTTELMMSNEIDKEKVKEILEK